MDLEKIDSYLQAVDLGGVPGWRSDLPFDVRPLAQGEYNLNYLIRQGDRRWVFRVNLGTQIDREDQIQYEYQALCLLAETGVTPRPYYIDDSHQLLPNGVLMMEYLPGEPLDYRRDLASAAQLFARIHSQTAGLQAHHLIVEERPLSMMVEECGGLLQVYFEDDQADPSIRSYLQDVLEWADEARHQEAYYLGDPWPCIINTEVNSGNFIVNRPRNTLHLIDWEKPLWGDPSQDLSHFGVPTTTLWKTDYSMDPADRQTFLDAYRSAMPDRHLRDTIADRVRLRDPFNCLRGISWSAMAWVTYQSGTHALKNQDTFNTISRYLDIGFLRRLFTPYVGEEI